MSSQPLSSSNLALSSLCRTSKTARQVYWWYSCLKLLPPHLHTLSSSCCWTIVAVWIVLLVMMLKSEKTWQCDPFIHIHSINNCHEFQLLLEPFRFLYNLLANLNSWLLNLTFKSWRWSFYWCKIFSTSKVSQFHRCRGRWISKIAYWLTVCDTKRTQNLLSNCDCFIHCRWIVYHQLFSNLILQVLFEYVRGFCFTYIFDKYLKITKFFNVFMYTSFLLQIPQLHSCNLKRINCLKILQKWWNCRSRDSNKNYIHHTYSLASRLSMQMKYDNSHILKPIVKSYLK